MTFERSLIILVA